MSVATARFYKMKGSISSGEYPLLATGQDLSTYLIHSVSVKYAKGLQTRIVVPEFTGYETVNVVELDGSYYWVSAWKEATTLNGTVAMVLDYMGPTSLIRYGDTVKGIYKKTATNECEYLKQEVSNTYRIVHSADTLEPTDLEFGMVVDAASGRDEFGYWVQISGYWKDPNTQETRLRRVGFPIAVSDDSLRPTGTRLPAPRSGGTPGYFPSFANIIDDITLYTTLQADQIIDCSVSKRCPHKFGKRTITSGGDVLTEITILNDNGYASTLQVMSDNSTCVYFINEGGDYYSTATQTLRMDVSDAVKRQCGSIQIRDWNENAIMEIPMTEDQVDIDFTVLADESGIYTIVSHNETMISIPEGKLPYIENTWETYKAYQMNSDRQAMENAIRFAEYQRDTQRVVGTVNSAINGATSGAMTGFMSGSGGAGAAALAVGGAVASAITDLYAQDRAMELTRLQTSAEYELSMKRSIDQAQTSYNAAYGLIYIALNEIKSLRVCLTLPAFPNADYFDDWVANFGYPAEGVLSVAIDYGYYSGILLSTTSDQSGMYWDRMNETFERGFKFVSPR